MIDKQLKGVSLLSVIGNYHFCKLIESFNTIKTLFLRAQTDSFPNLIGIYSK